MNISLFCSYVALIKSHVFGFYGFQTVPEQKEIFVKVSSEIKSWLKNDATFLSKIIAFDESLFHHYGFNTTGLREDIFHYQRQYVKIQRQFRKTNHRMGNITEWIPVFEDWIGKKHKYFAHKVVHIDRCNIIISSIRTYIYFLLIYQNSIFLNLGSFLNIVI